MWDKVRPAMVSPMLQALFAYWDEQRAGRRFPRRIDIEPRAIALVLPHIYLIDLERGGAEPAALSFKVRLAGTFIDAACGKSGEHGKLESMDFGSQRDAVLADYRRVAESGAPLVATYDFVGRSGRHFAYERLLLPLAVAVADRVDMIMGAIAFQAPVPTPDLPPNETRWIKR